jgi:tetratricopeptide (TPR) repeat protein
MRFANLQGWVVFALDSRFRGNDGGFVSTSNDLTTRRWAWPLGIVCFAILSFIIPLQGQPQAPLPAGPQAPRPVTASSTPNLLPIPRPTPSTDPAVKQQVDDAWSEFQAVSAKQGAAPEELANAYGQLGMVYHAYGFIDAAAVCYQNAHSLAPRDYRWPYYAGRLYQDEGGNKNAITYLKMAQELNPDDIAVLINLAQTYQADGQMDPAQALFEKAIAVDPSQAAAQAGLGEIALSKGNFALAIRSLETALKLQPAATGLHYPLAMAYRKSGDVTNALAHLQKKGPGRTTVPDPLMDEVMDLKRGQRALWIQGNKALAEGRLDDAIKIYQQMLATADKSDPIPRIHLGIAMAQAGDLKGAVEQYQEILRLAPGSAVAHYNLGVLSLELKSEDEALSHFNAAVSLDPGFRLAHFQMANLLMRKGRAAEAIPHYQRAIELGLTNDFVRLMKAMALVRIKRYAEAKRELEEGVAALPESADLTLALARLLAASPDKSLRDGPRALQLVQKLLKGNPSPDLDLLETYGMALASVGKFKEAANLLSQMIADLEKMKRNDIVAELEPNLNLYEHGRACTLPWRDDDPIFSPQPGKMVLFVPHRGIPMEKGAASSP